jgi:hypothetical protein
LQPFARLLSGSPDAIDHIWLHAESILPPAQALGVALAMREVHLQLGTQPAPRPDATAADPDWNLLRRLPCWTLPLDGLAGGSAPAADGPVAPEP